MSGMSGGPGLTGMTSTSGGSGVGNVSVTGRPGHGRPAGTGDERSTA